MLHWVINLIPALAAGIIIYLTFLLGKSFRCGGPGMLRGLCCLLERTPALDAFLLFIFRSVLIAAAVTVAFGSISNHIVLSLDILYFISALLLILYHTLKNPPVLLSK